MRSVWGPDGDGRRPRFGRSQEFRKCIECWLYQNVCHVIRDHEENKPAYVGPRYFIRHAELDMHPLDAGDRRGVLREEQGRSPRLPATTGPPPHRRHAGFIAATSPASEL